MLFNSVIDGWYGTNTSWAFVYRSIAAFELLINEIAVRNNLPKGEIKNLTPGTNAVFRMEDYVYKIFAPEESGISTALDFKYELAGMEHAEKACISIPQVVAKGCIKDKYIFNYIVMEYINAPEARETLPLCNEKEKHNIALNLKNGLNKLNIPYAGNVLPNMQKTDFERWNSFPASLIKEIVEIKKGVTEEIVFVHGDLTEDNILLQKEKYVVLDFADCHVAPACYEWPPIVFSFMKCDKVMLNAFFDNWQNDVFIEKLSKAVAYHYYGAEFLKELCQDLNLEYKSINSFLKMQDIIRRKIYS